MTELMVTALVLGIAGLDPAGLLIAVGAMSAGVRRPTIIGFAVITVLGTAALGTVLAFTLGAQLEDIDWASLAPPDEVAAAVEIALALGLVLWGVSRLRRPGARPPRPAGKKRSGIALLLLGALFAASAFLDPTFLGLVVLAARGDSLVAAAGANLIWVVVSQLPLVVLAGAVLLGRHARFVAWVQGVLGRFRPVLARLGTGLLLLVGGVLAADAIAWFATGVFLIGDSG